MPFRGFARPGLPGAGLLVLFAIACGDDTTQPPGASGADLLATVSGATTAAVGTEVTYTLRVTNQGPDASAQVAVQMTLSGAYEVVSISDDGQRTNDVVTWPALGSLASQSQVEHTVALRPTDAGTLTAVATASAATADPDASNNDGSAGTATLTTQVSVQADLQITSDMPIAADGGDTLLVTLTTTNAGPSPAGAVVVTYSLPITVDVVSISGGGTRSGGTVTWPAADLSAGDAFVHTITLVTPMVGPLETTAGVDAPGTDPVSSNNQLQHRTVVTATPIRTIQGSIVGEQFGWEVERIGDVTGDGAADFSVSAPFGNGNGASSGRIYVYSGADGSLIWRFDGVAGDVLGIDMEAGTDFTGDGLPELIVGAPAPNNAGTPGRVYIYSLSDGKTVQVLDGENAGDRFGYSAGSAGDVNDDGTPDVYVGARDHDAAGSNAGRAYVYSGADWSLLLTVDGTSANDRFGQAGRGVGDLNNDGFDDFAVGAPDYGATGGGRVYVISGATGQDLFPPIEADANAVDFGSFWIFSPGDLNSDGVADIFASDIGNGAQGQLSGRAYVFSGTDGGNVLTLTGESSGDQYGIGHPAGDLDGDGVTDLSIAAWLSSEGASQGGKVYLISGATGTTLRTITSTSAGENFGFDAFVVGDLTGDGIPDIAVSGGISGSTTGHVKIYAGVNP